MTIKEAGDYMKSHGDDVLAKARRSGFVCPCCGSGSGKNGTGITKNKNNNTYSCWGRGNCYKGATILDIFAIRDGISRDKCNYVEIVKNAAREFNITVDNKNNYVIPERKEVKAEPVYTQKEEINDDEDRTKYCQFASMHLKETDYPTERGISDETCKRFNIGFVRYWRHPKAPYMSPSPRLIIPTSPTSFIARSTERNPSLDKVMKVGHIHFFNEDTLKEKTDKPLFIVEGEFDALSVEEMGHSALALGGISNIEKFVNEIKENGGLNRPIVLSLDNDDPGRDAEEKLSSLLKEENIPFHREEVSLSYKDANEALQNDRDSFEERLNSIEKEVKYRNNLSPIEDDKIENKRSIKI